MYIKTLRENVQSTENAYKHAYMCRAREFFIPWNIKPIAYDSTFFPFFLTKAETASFYFFKKDFH